MEKQEPRLLGAVEVADRLGVCRTKAYEIIRELNDEMEIRGCKVIAGRVSNEIFEEAFFNPKGGARHDCEAIQERHLVHVVPMQEQVRQGSAQVQARFQYCGRSPGVGGRLHRLRWMHHGHDVR